MKNKNYETTHCAVFFRNAGKVNSLSRNDQELLNQLCGLYPAPGNASSNERFDHSQRYFIHKRWFIIKYINLNVKEISQL